MIKSKFLVEKKTANEYYNVVPTTRALTLVWAGRRVHKVLKQKECRAIADH